MLPSVAPAHTDLAETGAPLWAIIFAGGIGSRFWPLSTPTRPKQLLRLISEQPLLLDTVRRLQPAIPADRVLVLTSSDIAPAIKSAISMVPEMNILVEPRPLGTAAALAWGCRKWRDGPGRRRCAAPSMPMSPSAFPRNSAGCCVARARWPSARRRWWRWA